MFADSTTGDLNYDGVVDLLDVTGFVEAISSGRCRYEADINLDRMTSLLDVHPFVELLVGG